MERNVDCNDDLKVIVRGQITGMKKVSTGGYRIQIDIFGTREDTLAYLALHGDAFQKNITLTVRPMDEEI